MKEADVPSAASTRRDRLPSPGQPAYKTYRWAVVIMLWLICVFNYADRQAIASVHTYLQHDFGFNDAQFGLIMSSFMIVYAITAPFAGQVGDVLARKWIIIFGLYIWSAITGFTALGRNLWQLVFVRGGTGLGETFYFPASMSMVSDYHATSTRSRAMGLHQTGVYIGTIAGGWFAGMLAVHYGDWRHPFIIFGAAGIVLGLVLMLFIREPKRNEAQQYETPQESTATEPDASKAPKFGREGGTYIGLVAVTGLLAYGLHLAGLDLWIMPVACAIALVYAISIFVKWARTTSSIILLLAFVGANFVAMQFIMWTQTFLGRKFNLNEAEAGLYGTMYIQLGSLVGAMAGGALADWWRKFAPGGRMLAQFVGLLIGAPLIYAFGATRSWAVICVVMALFGICKGAYDAGIWASLFDVVPAARRGASVGVMNMVAWLSGGVGVWLMGAHTDTYVKAMSHGSTDKTFLLDLKVRAMSSGFEALTVIYLVTAVLLLVAALRYARVDVAKASAGGEALLVH